MSIAQTTLPIDSGETVTYCFDFSRFPEWKNGETLSAPAAPAVAGLTLGTPSVSTADFDDGDGVVVPAGAGVLLAVADATAGDEYTVAVYADFSGGNTRCVKLILDAE